MKVFRPKKAVVLEGSVGFPNLVAYSIYYTDPINYLSMVTEKLKEDCEGEDSVQCGHRCYQYIEITEDD